MENCIRFVVSLDVDNQKGTGYINVSALIMSIRYLLSEPGKSTLNVLNYKYKFFPPQKYLSTSTFLFGEMYLSTFRVLSKCT